MQEEGKGSLDLRIVIWSQADPHPASWQLISMLRSLITLRVSIYKWSIWVLLNQTLGLPEVEGVQILSTAET